VRNKKRRAEACGFHSVQHSLPADVEQEQVLALVDALNNDDAIHGILVQLPLPDHLDEETITQSISPTKDVDGFHYVNIGKLSAGHTADAFIPCTPAGCLMMIEEEIGADFSGLNAVVIGRSNIVGKPMAALLLQRNATVTVTHSRTKDLPGVVRNADIVVAAVGRANMVKGDWIRPGAIVIDVGMNRIEREIDGEVKAKLTGDVDYDEVAEVAAAITPVPGGVGPMTITMLMFNTLRSARLAAGLEG
jgi:methylenetetrahydrofolate dehydrogenase (NADP+)/methenyltetrahydrofolate cyclohydrolase